MRELARAKGRKDGDILFLQGMMFVVGSTDEEAYRKWGELEEWRSPEAQTAYFSSLSGMDLGRYDPATPLEDIIEEIARVETAATLMPAGDDRLTDATWVSGGEVLGTSPPPTSVRSRRRGGG